MDIGAGPRPGHVGELRLRRFRAGELAGASHDETADHVDSCGACRARLRMLDDEQRAFEREIPLARFTGGVERARRVPRTRPRRAWAWTATTVLCAAAGVALVARTGVFEPASAPGTGLNQIKGTRSVEALIRIARADGSGQRSAAPGTTAALRAGDRVRIGYRVPAVRHLIAVSLDDAGAITPLYPQSGAALPVAPRPETTYLDDSVEFTGHGGERVWLVLASAPVTVAEVGRAVKAAVASAGSKSDGLGPIEIPGNKVESFSWHFDKP
jgi:hypothetical protein